MTNAAWITDPHLNFVSPEVRVAFCEELRSSTADAFLIGGDLGEAPTFAAYLREIGAAVERPVYFVLGNHDYYLGSIASVRRAAEALSVEDSRLHWLPRAGAVRLGPKTALIGHDGWGDARSGNFLNSEVILNDYFLIEELSRIAPQPADWDSPETRIPLQHRLRGLGDEAADHFRKTLPDVLGWAERIVVLTHVPPFREACLYRGQISNDQWAPHFTCVAAGQALQEFMTAHPELQMTVLCGHTHGGGRCHILPNLEVITGAAEYGTPRIQDVLSVS